MQTFVVTHIKTLTQPGKITVGLAQRGQFANQVQEIQLVNYTIDGNGSALPKVIFLKGTFGTGMATHMNVSVNKTTILDNIDSSLPLYSAAIGFGSNNPRIFASNPGGCVTFANANLSLYTLDSAGTPVDFIDYTQLTLEFLLKPL